MAEINDFQGWQETTALNLNRFINTNTGVLKERHQHQGVYEKYTCTYYGDFASYYVRVKEAKKVYLGKVVSLNYYLEIRGSLHKNYAGQNHSRFSWTQLQCEINSICERFLIDPSQAKITRLEIGLNVKLPFETYTFLQTSLITCKHKSFNAYPSKDGISLGWNSHFHQYIVKIYDKGKQYNLSHNLLRFEIQFLKMQPLKVFGIQKLSDLTHKDKVYNLKKLLIKAWDDVLLYDTSIDLEDLKLKPAQKEMLLNGRNPKYWEQLSGVECNNKKKAFRKLVLSLGQKNHEFIRQLIDEEWDSLFK